MRSMRRRCCRNVLSCRPRRHRSSSLRRQLALACDPSIRMSLMSDDLPEPLTPVTPTKQPSGISTVRFLRLLWRAPTMVILRSVGWRRCFGIAICFLAGEILAGDAVGFLDDVGVRAGGDDVAAAHAGAGAEIDDVIGGAHRVFIVFDDQDGVAHVAQLFEAAQQAFVVARMQADATARRGYRGRRRGRSRSGRRGGCAGPRRRTG